MKDKGSSTIFVAGVMVLTAEASPLALGGKQAVTQIDCRPCLLHMGVNLKGFCLGEHGYEKRPYSHICMFLREEGF